MALSKPEIPATNLIKDAPKQKISTLLPSYGFKRLTSGGLYPDVPKFPFIF